MFIVTTIHLKFKKFFKQNKIYTIVFTNNYF